MSFNSHKRRRDDDDDQGADEFRSHQRPQFQKRLRQELSQELQLAIKLCEDITKLGEKSLKSFGNDINYMSFPISEEISESTEIRNALLKTFLAVIIEQPHKLPLLGALLEVCNLRNSMVGKYVFEFLHQKAQELIDTTKEIDEFSSGNLNKLKLILRFLAVCRKLIVNDGVFKIFEQFLTIAVELSKTQSSTGHHSGVLDLIFYNVVLSIPYLQFYGESEESINKLIDLAKQFEIFQGESTELYEHFDNAVVKLEPPYGSKSLIKLVLPLVESPGKVPFIDTNKLIEPLLQELNNYESTQHSLPQFSISLETFNLLDDLEKPGSLSGNIDSLWNYPRMVLEVYSNQTHGFETKPSIESYFGLLLNDICQDVIQNMEFNKNSVSQQLMILDQFFEPLTFAKLGSSIDKLTILNDKKNGTILEVDPEDPLNFRIKKLIEEVDQEFEEGLLSTWKVEDVLTEAILNLIFNLPDVSNPIIYFYTVLVECCSKESKLMAPVFGRAIRFFFTNILILDFELRSRYLDWLAVQLSNFRFQWKWHEWTEYITKLGHLKYHPIMIFIKNLILKEIRLSSVAKIKETLPEEFYQYLDISLNDSKYIEDYDVSIFGKFWNEEASAKLSLKFIQDSNEENKEQCNEIFKLLEVSTEESVADDVIGKLDALDKDLNFVINLVFQSVCVVGSRSISHVKFFIEKRQSLLIKILNHYKADIKDPELIDKYVTESVLRVWNHEPQIGYLILEMLLTSKIIGWKKYLENLFESNAVVLNISAIESLLRVMSNLDLYNIDSAIFHTAYKLIEAKLNDLVTSAKDKQFEITNVEDEQDDDKWLYSELLKLTKSLLRKFSGHYKGYDDVQIEDEKTKEIIKSYFAHLK